MTGRAHRTAGLFVAALAIGSGSCGRGTPDVLALVPRDAAMVVYVPCLGRLWAHAEVARGILLRQALFELDPTAWLAAGAGIDLRDPSAPRRLGLDPSRGAALVVGPAGQSMTVLVPVEDGQRFEGWLHGQLARGAAARFGEAQRDGRRVGFVRDSVAGPVRLAWARDGDFERIAVRAPGRDLIGLAAGSRKAESAAGEAQLVPALAARADRDDLVVGITGAGLASMLPALDIEGQRARLGLERWVGAATLGVRVDAGGLAFAFRDRYPDGVDRGSGILGARGEAASADLVAPLLRPDTVGVLRGALRPDELPRIAGLRSLLTVMVSPRALDRTLAPLSGAFALGLFVAQQRGAPSTLQPVLVLATTGGAGDRAAFEEMASALAKAGDTSERRHVRGGGVEEVVLDDGWLGRVAVARDPTHATWLLGTTAGVNRALDPSTPRPPRWLAAGELERLRAAGGAVGYLEPAALAAALGPLGSSSTEGDAVLSLGLRALSAIAIGGDATPQGCSLTVQLLVPGRG